MSGRIAALVVLAAAMASPARAEELVRSAWANPDSPWLIQDPMPVPLVLLESPAPYRAPYRLPTWGQALQLHDAVVVLGLHAAEMLDSRIWPPGLDGSPLTLLSSSPYLMLAFFTQIPLLMALGVSVRFPSIVPFGSPWLRWEGSLGALAANGLVGMPAESPGCSSPFCALTDAQIAAVHDRRAADWARVLEAPWELQYEKLVRSERNSFFYNRVQSTYWVYTVIQFIELSLLLPQAYGDDPAWAWDLFRPELGYLARPEHEGVRRVDLDDLTDDERSYLRQLRDLDGLNLLDGFLLAGWTQGLPLPSPLGGVLRVNGALRHRRTASGDMIALSILARQEPVKAEASVELYRSRSMLLPGLTLRLHRYPVRWGGLTVLTSVAASGWLQPQDQSFLATSAAPGGALRLSGAVPLTEFCEGFLELRAKTPGWVAGDPDLGAGVQVGAGLNLLLGTAKGPVPPMTPSSSSSSSTSD